MSKTKAAIKITTLSLYSPWGSNRGQEGGDIVLDVGHRQGDPFRVKPDPLIGPGIPTLGL